MPKEITIMGIDTSCDDTGIALLQIQNPKSKIQNSEIKILSNVVSSQVKLHAKYGGVYPTLAKREHQKNLVPVLMQALKEANALKMMPRVTLSKAKGLSQKIPHYVRNDKISVLEKILEREGELAEKLIVFLKKYEKPKIDAIAVTVGPGLEPCLWQGINFAKALASYWKIPVIAVNHIEAHLLANFLGNRNEPSSFLSFFLTRMSSAHSCSPAMGLVVSGGHTELILIKKIGKYQIIGETLDDAAGECFDKTARILGLGYPGGPAIAQLAKQFSLLTTNYSLPTILPRPMINSKDFNFSFSGLKTAVLYNFKSQTPAIQKSKQYKKAMAHEIQQAIIDVLIKKTIKACNAFGAKTIILGGGVAANEELRKRFDYQLQIEDGEYARTTTNYQLLTFSFPPPILCMDNGAMVAITGLLHLKQTTPWQKLIAQGNLKI